MYGLAFLFKGIGSSSLFSSTKPLFAFAPPVDLAPVALVPVGFRVWVGSIWGGL